MLLFALNTSMLGLSIIGTLRQNDLMSLIVIPCSFVISFIYNFLIIPIIAKHSNLGRQIVLTYISRDENTARTLIETANTNHIKAGEMLVVLNLALDLRTSNISELLAAISRLNYQQIPFLNTLWSAEAASCEARGEPTPFILRSLINQVDTVRTHEYSFWRSVWLSDIGDLPEIAARLGRSKSRLAFAVKRESETTPMIINHPIFDGDTRVGILVHNSRKLKLQILDNFTWEDILVVINLVVVTIIAFHFHASEIRETFVISDAFGKFKTFIDAHFNVTVSAFTRKFDPSTLVALSERYHAYENINIFPVRYDCFDTLVTDFETAVTNGQYVPESYYDFISQCNYTFAEYDEYYHTTANISASTSLISTLAVVLFPISWVIVILVRLFFKMRNAGKQFGKFRTVSKAALERTYGFSNAENSLPIKKRINPFVTFTGYLAYGLAGFTVILAYSIILIFDYDNTYNNITYLRATIHTTGETLRTIVLLSAGLINKLYGDDNGIYIAIAHYCYALVLHNSEIQTTAKPFADEIYQIFLNHTFDEPLDYQACAATIFKISDNLQNILAQIWDAYYSYINRFIRTAFTMLICTIMIGFFALNLTVIAHAEERECSQLYEYAQGIDAETPEVVFDNKIDLGEADLTLAVVDPDGKMIVATPKARRLLEEREAHQKMMELVEYFTMNIKQEACEVDFDSCVVKAEPYYSFSKDKITLNHVIMLEAEYSDIRQARLQQNIDRIYNEWLPSFVDREAKFPLLLESSSRMLILILAKLHRFDEWVATVTPEIAQQFRREVSAIFRENSDYSIISETNDLTVALIKREASVSVWHIIEIGGDFAREIMMHMRNLQKKYNTNIQIKVMLFKFKEPQMYIPDTHAGRFAFISGSIRTAEDYIRMAPTMSITYTTERKEMKAVNTTKAKSCYSANGVPFELYFVV